MNYSTMLKPDRPYTGLPHDRHEISVESVGSNASLFFLRKDSFPKPQTPATVRSPLLKKN